MTNITRRIEKLESKIGEKKLIVIMLLRFSKEMLSNPAKRTAKAKPESCPGCDAKIAEARGTAINGTIVIECPADCPNL